MKFLIPNSASLIKYGGLAQLGERLLRKQEVTGSNPALSTTKRLTEDAKQFAFSLSLLRDSDMYLEN